MNIRKTFRLAAMGFGAALAVLSAAPGEARDKGNQVFIIVDGKGQQHDFSRDRGAGGSSHSGRIGPVDNRNGRGKPDRVGRPGEEIHSIRDKNRSRSFDRRSRRDFDRRDRDDFDIDPFAGYPLPFGYYDPMMYGAEGAGAPGAASPRDLGYLEGFSSGQIDRVQGNLYNPRQYERSNDPDYFEGFVEGYQDGWRR